MRRPFQAYLDELVVPARRDPTPPAQSDGSAGSPFARARAAGLVRHGLGLLVAHLLSIGALVTSFSCVGRAALSGRLDRGWFLPFSLALLSTIPLRFVTRWLEGVVAVGLGGWLKENLFHAALSTDTELLRERGSGRILAEALETEAIAILGASGGLQIVLALLELVTLELVLLGGASGPLESGLSILALLTFILLAAKHLAERSRWTQARLGQTHELLENMAAHRTRAVQVQPADWHAGEDERLERYADTSASFDRSQARLESLPQAYVIVAVAGLAPALFAGDATAARMAVTLGAILFGASSFERLAAGFLRGAEAWLSWREAQSALNTQLPTEPGVELREPSAVEGTLLQGVELAFAHRGRAEPVLESCSLDVREGDRILVAGASGSGKSTLVALLAGLRAPASGFVLAQGLDRYTLGDQRWRRRVVLAPQAHENHLFSAGLGFNLLLGRPYPHSPSDYAEALEVCQELGLGSLLARMPSGLQQFVGEMGWQLSQGEQSRVFLARALLQRADVVVLDETLAALDPDTFKQCLSAVQRRARGLILVAHP
ncbi:MAG TPA: ATP-binding cassette domain-containing protein [Polyangiaceae bacterium]|nr:ATP-binding cassette domain-containing protein [Polyangiaceae bacterium]